MLQNRPLCCFPASSPSPSFSSSSCSFAILIFVRFPYLNQPEHEEHYSSSPLPPSHPQHNSLLYFIHLCVSISVSFFSPLVRVFTPLLFFCHARAIRSPSIHILQRAPPPPLLTHSFGVCHSIVSTCPPYAYLSDEFPIHRKVIRGNVWIMKKISRSRYYLWYHVMYKIRTAGNARETSEENRAGWRVALETSIFLFLDFTRFP